MYERDKTKLEKRRIETLSAITEERVYVEAMAQRPRSATDPLDHALLETVLRRLAEIEAKAREVANVDELDDLQDDAEEQGDFSAYFCPVADVRTEGQIVIDEIDGWGIPAAPLKSLRELLDSKLGCGSRSHRANGGQRTRSVAALVGNRSTLSDGWCK